MLNMPKYILVIIALSLVIYANTLRNDFVSDDIAAIVNNPDIGKLFGAPSLPSFLNALDYRIGGLSTPAYHLTSMLLNTLDCILAFFFLLLFFQPLSAFFGALIFTSHPVHAESVAWISGRPYLLFTFFTLAAFLLYARATGKGKLKLTPYLGSLAMYLFSFCSSYLAFLFPGMLLLYDFTFGRVKKNWRLWPGYFALAGLRLLLVTQAVKNRVVQIRAETGSTALLNPFYNAVYSFFSHLWLLLWPQNLTLYHEPAVISRQQLNLGIIAFLLLILALPFIYRKEKRLFFALGIFILFLAPTYSPVIISWLVAERYLYLPAISLAFFLSFFIEQAGPHTKDFGVGAGRHQALTRPVYILVILLVLLYSLRTVMRNADWKSHASIWRATVKVSPNSHRAHNNMGDVYAREGNLEKSEQEFREALRLVPRYADAEHNLANICQARGKVEEAQEHYRQAIAINPALYQSYMNLGIIYYNKGEQAAARECWLKVKQLKPDEPQVDKLLEAVK